MAVLMAVGGDAARQFAHGGETARCLAQLLGARTFVGVLLRAARVQAHQRFVVLFGGRRELYGDACCSVGGVAMIPMTITITTIIIMLR